MAISEPRSRGLQASCRNASSSPLAELTKRRSRSFSKTLRTPRPRPAWFSSECRCAHPGGGQMPLAPAIEFEARFNARGARSLPRPALENAPAAAGANANATRPRPRAARASSRTLALSCHPRGSARGIGRITELLPAYATVVRYECRKALASGPLRSPPLIRPASAAPTGSTRKSGWRTRIGT